MSRGEIPDDVAAYVVAVIRSVADLEALLLLRSEPGRDWTPAQVARRLYVSDPEAAGVLDHLVARGLASIDGEACRYAADASADGKVECIARLYSTHLIPLTRLIHERPTSRVQEFADAFKFRKDGD